MAARSHALVPIERCPITVPRLAEAPAIAEALAAPLGGGDKPLDAQVTATASGLDVDIRGHGRVSEGARAALTRLATEHDLARLSIHGDLVVAPRQAAVTMQGIALVPPPGGFLQATEAGEETLAALVRAAVPDRARRVADLFAGCGPFALSLARSAEVHAVEANAAALAALDGAVRRTPGLRRVVTEVRDLFRRPLLAPELDRFDAVVLDPPRAGAQAQAGQLAASSVGTVVSVSCDPGSFARDAATLLAGGYALESVTPVDQFRHSAHVEIVGLFRRPSATKRRR